MMIREITCRIGGQKGQPGGDLRGLIAADKRRGWTH